MSVTIGAALRETFAQKWTAEQRQAIEDVLDAALAWRSGKLPLNKAAEQGECADRNGITLTPPRAQAAAMLTADPADPRRAALAAMLDALIARQPGVVLTHQGVMTDEAIYAQRLDPRSLPIKERSDPWDTEITL